MSLKNWRLSNSLDLWKKKDDTGTAIEMDSSIITTLVVHLLLMDRVFSSGSTFLENKISSMDEVDNTLIEFFVALNVAYLQEEDPWYILSARTSTVKLHESLNQLFRIYPMVVCSDQQTCDYPKSFISSSLFVVFLDDLSGDTLSKNYDILSKCTTDCKLLMVLESDISVNVTDVLEFFLRIRKNHIRHGELVHVNKDSVQHYSVSNSDDCSLRVDSGFVWQPGTELRNISSLELFSIRNYMGCPMTVAATQHMSEVVAERNDDDSFSIVGGRDGMLALTIAESLNSTVVLKYQDSIDPTATILMVVFDTVDFVTTRLTPLTNNVVSFVVTFEDECVTWAVPRIMKTTYDVVLSEFPWDVWALVGTVFVVGCVIVRIPQSVVPTRNGDRRAISIVEHILNVVAIHLGLPVTRDLVTIGGKLLFLEYLLYATVITTAYKTSLASILSTIKVMPTINDVSGMIEANLTVGGSTYYKIQIEQSNENDLPWQLLQLFQVYDNHSEAMDRLEVDPGFAYFASRSALTYDKQLIVKTRKLIKYDILKTCGLKFPATLVFPKGSYLINHVNKIIFRVLEFGLLDYWDRASYVNDNILESINADRFFGQDTMQKLISAFIFYFGCIAVCIFVLLAEILNVRLNR